MQRKKDQLPPGLLTKFSATLCNHKTMKPPSTNARVADHSTKGVQLTMLADYTSDPCHDPQWGIGPQYEAHQSVGVGIPVPPYPLGHQGVQNPPWFQLAGHIGPYGYLYGLPTQPYPLQSSTHSYMLPEDYGFDPGVGGNINTFFTVSYEHTSAHGCAVPGYEDPGNFPRCDTNPGSPIHLTTNISVLSSRVSSLYLSQEVRHHSVRKAHWY